MVCGIVVRQCCARWRRRQKWVGCCRQGGAVPGGGIVEGLCGRQRLAVVIGVESLQEVAEVADIDAGRGRPGVGHVSVEGAREGRGGAVVASRGLRVGVGGRLVGGVFVFGSGFAGVGGLRPVPRGGGVVWSVFDGMCVELWRVGHGWHHLECGVKTASRQVVVVDAVVGVASVVADRLGVVAGGVGARNVSVVVDE